MPNGETDAHRKKSTTTSEKKRNFLQLGGWWMLGSNECKYIRRRAYMRTLRIDWYWLLVTLNHWSFCGRFSAMYIVVVFVVVVVPFFGCRSILSSDFWTWMCVCVWRRHYREMFKRNENSKEKYTSDIYSVLGSNHVNRNQFDLFDVVERFNDVKQDTIRYPNFFFLVTFFSSFLRGVCVCGLGYFVSILHDEKK